MADITSISTELTRILSSKASLKDILTKFGVTIPQGAKLGDLVSVLSGLLSGNTLFISSFADTRHFGNDTQITKILLANGITTIPTSAFQDYEALVSVIFPSTLITISGEAFMECIKLISLVLPQSVTFLGDACFNECKALSFIVLPKNVTTIGGGCFYGCSALKYVQCLAVTPPTLGGQAFDSTNNCPIYVPDASLSTYQSATNWSAYSSRLKALSTFINQ